MTVDFGASADTLAVSGSYLLNSSFMVNGVGTGDTVNFSGTGPMSLTVAGTAGNDTLAVTATGTAAGSYVLTSSGVAGTRILHRSSRTYLQRWGRRR